MHFQEPEFFHLLWLLPLLGLFFWLASRRRARLLGLFGRRDLVSRLSSPVIPGMGFLRSALLLCALLFLILTLARPQYGKKPVILKREGRDIVFLLDTSLSMLADDIKPDRLSRARFEIVGLLDRLEGDRIALVPFAGDAFTLCPLTTDYSAAALFLDGVDTDLISQPGTNIDRALREGAKVFDSQQTKYKVMILITDGEELEGDALETARAIRNEGIHLYAIGIGTPDGVPIPVKDAGGRVVDYKRDNRGEVVLSRLGESLLADLARTGGGQYYRAGTGAIELDRIFEDIAKLEKRQLETREFSLYQDRYQWFLALSVALLFVEAVLWDRRRMKADSAAWHGRFE